MKTGHLFTTHLPDFMKMDLGLGSNEAHPLPLVLDAWLGGESHRHALATFSSQSGLGSERTEVRELSTHGFQIATLTEPQRNAFYRALGMLFRDRLKISALERLANIYFGTASVRRGHPYQKQTLSENARLPLRLSEAHDADTLLFVEAGTETNQERANEFLHNASILVPPSFRLKITGPRVPATAMPNVIPLVANTRMKGWRL